MTANRKMLAVSGLLSGAVVWGAIWYPYRVLEKAGISGALSTLLTYLIPVLLGLAFFGTKALGLRRAGWVVGATALCAGWTNLAYVLAMIQGEVMRVLLLFYLSPFWTVIFARLLLGERPTLAGYGVMALSLAGAMVMLWQPALGLPLPGNRAEWLGLSAGLTFALSNVFSRKARDVDVALKSLAIWAGVVVLALVPVLSNAGQLQSLAALSPQGWLWLVATGAAIFGVTLAVQYGVSHTPANQAIVIFLFELVVGAISAYYLAGEQMSAREWVGGAMIVAASLFSGELEREHD